MIPIIDWNLRQLNQMRHTSIHSGGGVQGYKCPFGNGLRDSANDRAARAGIQTRTGGKWSAKTSVDQAEIMRHLRDIIGNTRLARQGLGLSHFQQWSKISAAERRTMDQAEVRRTEDDQRKARATRGLDKVEHVRAGVNLGGTVEERPVQDIVPRVVSI